MDKNPNILIVDDNPENLQVLGDMLEQQGYEVRIATNGAEALQAAAAFPPDLILLDILMPDMDGYEVCRRLKADAELQPIPVIFISALGMSEQKIQAFREGAVDYVTKPFQVEEVVARVRTHIQLVHMDELKREIAERKQAEVELTKYRDKLEELVTIRTAEIEQKRADLETMNKVFVNRELRMIELKERIKELERTHENSAGSGRQQG